MIPTAFFDHIYKPAIALAVAGTAYIAESATPDIPGVPGWLTSLGLPVAFLVAVIYALVSNNRSLREEQAGRRKDWELFSTKLERILMDTIESGNKSREELIRATQQQTAELSRLSSRVTGCPHRDP
jgi:hypothetical protein